MNPGFVGKNDSPLDYFFGVKDSLVICKDGDPNYKPKWGPWCNVERNRKQDESLSFEDDTQFDTHMVGPWVSFQNICRINTFIAHEMHTW